MPEARRPLNKAVAHYLFIQSKEVPDEQAKLLRAAALLLLSSPIPQRLLEEVGKMACNDDPLYKADIRAGPDLDEVWELGL